MDHMVDTCPAGGRLPERVELINGPRPLLRRFFAWADEAASERGVTLRFASLDDLLVEMWIRAVWRSQTAFIEALQVRDPMTAAIGGALAIYDFAERQRDDARLLAALRREDLIERVDSPHLRRQLEDLNRPLADAIAQLTRRLFARASPGNIEKTIFSVVDLPMGAIRRHLVAGTPFPHTLRDQLEAAVRAALLSAGANTSRSGSAAIRARDVATERSG